MCAHVCVSPPPSHHLYFSPAPSPTSSPPNFNAFTPTNSSNLWETLFPQAGGRGRRAGLRSPPPLPSSSLLGKGPAWLPRPFLQTGLVCSPQAIDGLAAAYSKSE